MTGRLLLNLAILLLPPGLSLLALFAIADRAQIATNFQNTLLSALLGLCLSVWLLVYYNSSALRALRDVADKESSYRIRIIGSKRELEHVVRSMYHMRDAVIYAASINYTPQDVGISDSRKTDWAKDLYRKTNVRVRYNRIVSVRDERDRDWVRNMLEEKRNRNYDLRIIEGVPGELLFPNFVIVKQRKNYALFMSYRANSPEGRFAFSTEAPEIAEGLWAYASGFHAALPRAEDCVTKWDKRADGDSPGVSTSLCKWPFI